MILINIIMIAAISIILNIMEYFRIKNLKKENTSLEHKNQICKKTNGEFYNEIHDLKNELKQEQIEKHSAKYTIGVLKETIKIKEEKLTNQTAELEQFSRSSMKFIARYKELREHYQFLISNMELPEDLKIQIPEDDVNNLEKAINA